jgi:hypothetical protein
MIDEPATQRRIEVERAQVVHRDIDEGAREC